MSDLFAPVVSIVRTQRGRFFWAAWWSAPPAAHPFRKPDASNGGARSHEDAKREAEAAAKLTLVEIDGRWARAFVRSLRGLAPFTTTELNAAARGEAPLGPRRAPTRDPASLWTVLGVEAHASVDDIKRAYRKRALTVHPDHGGDAAEFRALHEAYEKALRRRRKQASRPKKRGA